jgi:hypothetical protein
MTTHQRLELAVSNQIIQDDVRAAPLSPGCFIDFPRHAADKELGSAL